MPLAPGHPLRACWAHLWHGYWEGSGDDTHTGASLRALLQKPRFLDKHIWRRKTGGLQAGPQRLILGLLQSC